jgi:hypothetical protein
MAVSAGTGGFRAGVGASWGTASTAVVAAGGGTVVGTVLGGFAFATLGIRDDCVSETPLVFRPALVATEASVFRSDGESFVSSRTATGFRVCSFASVGEGGVKSPLCSFVSVVAGWDVSSVGI